MLNLDDYFYFGKIVKPHSFDGRVNAWFDVDEPLLYSELEMVFIKIENNLVPHFIKSIKILNNKAILEFQDVDTIEVAELLAKKELYLPISMLPEKTGNSFYFHEIVDFELIDEEMGSVGIIKTVLDYPNQSLFQVISDNNKEVLIPVFGDIIKNVNREKKQILIKAPEGLIDIYLNE
jgi:16S rRNA processing protein RimM